MTVAVLVPSSACWCGWVWMLPPWARSTPSDNERWRSSRWRRVVGHRRAECGHHRAAGAGLMLTARVPVGALAGFSSSAFWILVSVLFFGYAMDKTGLAAAWPIASCWCSRPPTSAFCSRSCVSDPLTLGIPSMTVRTAILMPIAWALVQAIGLGLPSRGSALIILSAFEMAVLPGCALLTGALWGRTCPDCSQARGSRSAGSSMPGDVRPTMAWCVLVLLGNLPC